MEIVDYLRVVRQRWLSIVVIALMCAVAAAAFGLLQVPQYQARAQLFVSAGGGQDSASEVVQGSSFVEKRVASYVNLGSSPRVLQAVADEVGLGVTGTELEDAVSVSSPPQTVLIDIVATHADPSTAAEIANVTAVQLIAAIGQVEDVSLARPSVFQEAIAPAEPSTPRHAVNLAAGLIGGLLLGITFAVLKDVLDTRLRAREDIERVTSAAILGTFTSRHTATNRLVTQGHSFSQHAESFRQLRTHLRFTNLEGGPQSIVVSSAIEGEGKTTTAVNLAILLAESGVRVILVDADLRRPNVGKYLGMEEAVGLSTVLINQVTLADAIQPWGPDGSLKVLTSGASAPNPSELLGSTSMDKLLRQLEEQFELVVLDAPPLLPVTDPALLGQIASGIMLVVSADGRTHVEELQRALETVDAVNARLLGIVINRLPRSKRSSAYYHFNPEAAPARRRRRHEAALGRE